MDYIFIEPKKGGSGFEAAKNAYEKIQDIADSMKIKMFDDKGPLIRIKYLDKDGLLKLYTNNI
ncbi:hypothetical protein [Flammeovirga sp. SJP92]|uniref:hypothetical protein n=1 Tax=Flammeovirga sp. SJP92 TaxID=1775430 RepID=UPI0007874C3E|nr:hypothetical protein [Flammeovirga sp. SJP92]KXX69267.1 hypothetical protein AVL50_20110 [Flammeovirga sp. SJP92]